MYSLTYLAVWLYIHPRWVVETWNVLPMEGSGVTWALIISSVHVDRALSIEVSSHQGPVVLLHLWFWLVLGIPKAVALPLKIIIGRRWSNVRLRIIKYSCLLIWVAFACLILIDSDKARNIIWVATSSYRWVPEPKHLFKLVIRLRKVCWLISFVLSA